VKYIKAKEHLQNALGILNEIGGRKNEALCYGNLATVFKCLGEYGKAENVFRKHL